MQMSKTLPNFLILLLWWYSSFGTIFSWYFPFYKLWAILRSLPPRKDTGGQKVEIASVHFLSLGLKGGNFVFWR